jgi:hypothetical protein
LIDEGEVIYEAMSLTRLKGKFLVIESMHVKLRKRISNSAKRSVHGSINFIESGGYGFSLFRHGTLIMVMEKVNRTEEEDSIYIF